MADVVKKGTTTFFKESAGEARIVWMGHRDAEGNLAKEVTDSISKGNYYLLAQGWDACPCPCGCGSVPPGEAGKAVRLQGVRGLSGGEALILVETLCCGLTVQFEQTFMDDKDLGPYPGHYIDVKTIFVVTGVVPGSDITIVRHASTEWPERVLYQNKVYSDRLRFPWSGEVGSVTIHARHEGYEAVTHGPVALHLGTETTVALYQRPDPIETGEKERRCERCDSVLVPGNLGCPCINYPDFPAPPELLGDDYDGQRLTFPTKAKCPFCELYTGTLSGTFTVDRVGGTRLGIIRCGNVGQGGGKVRLVPEGTPESLDVEVPEGWAEAAQQPLVGYLQEERYEGWALGDLQAKRAALERTLNEETGRAVAVTAPLVDEIGVIDRLIMRGAK